MTQTFITYAFPATGAPYTRTMPDRLSDVHNVRDWGAVGDGVTDDLVAITAAINWNTQYRGAIYFPAGTYYVSGPIVFDPDPAVFGAPFLSFIGEMGLSIVTGNFADYIFRRQWANTDRWSGGHSIEKLTIINQHSAGGGIRLGAGQGYAIRDCDITANVAINDDNTSTFIDGGNLNGSFEGIIENCNLRPFNTLATGTVGINKTSDGPIKNCTVTGFDSGMQTSSGQGGATIYGCRFEHNNFGFQPGTPIEPTWGFGAGSQVTLAGCYFKNNGIAISAGGKTANFLGVFIEATTGSIAGNPQYGIETYGNSLKAVYQGVSVKGDYQQYGVYFTGGDATVNNAIMKSVGSVNSTGLGTWRLAEAMIVALKSCNVAPVYTVAKLPAVTVTITSTSWASTAGGTATVNFTTGGIDLSGLATKSAIMTVAGVTPSGYNGSFTGTVSPGGTQITYPLASDPGGSGGAAGTVFFTASDVGGTGNALEGHTYNVSDANTATWGAPVTAGGGSNRVKVRYTPTSWTVVGV